MADSADGRGRADGRGGAGGSGPAGGTGTTGRPGRAGRPIDLRHMRYVQAVGEFGNLRRAAAALHLAPQSLSEGIQAVERALGGPLFHRSSRGMVPTAAGEVFLARSGAALDAAEGAITAARAAVVAQPAPPLRIGVAVGLGGELRLLLTAFLAGHPDVDVQAVDVRTDDQADALRDGRLTAGLCYRPLPGPEVPGLVTTVVRHHPVRALLPLDRARGGEPVRLADLAELPLLLPPERDAAAVRRHSLDLFTAAGLRPRLGPDVRGHDLAVAMVAAGRGYTLCVPECHDTGGAPVRFAPLADDVAPVEVLLRARRGDRAAAPLVATARRLARDRAAPQQREAG